MNTSSARIGLWTATALVVGNMIASGIFMLPATLAGYGGISLVGWLVSGIGAMSLALVFGWLSHLRPAATGGPYAYTRDGMGDFAGFLVAWGYWISIWGTNAAITIAFVSYLSAFIPALATNPFAAVGTGMAAIWLLTWVNTKGIRQAGSVQLITTILKIVPLLLIIVVGPFFLDFDNFIPFNVSGSSDLKAIAQTTTLTLFAFLGLECATIPSGSILHPEKNIARATVLGTLFVTLLYFLCTVVVMGVLSPEELRVSNAPFADVAARIWGEPARYIMAGGAVIAAFGALNGWIVMQGQIPMAVANNQLFPSILGKLNQKGVPVFGIIISSILVSILMSMNFSRNLANTYQYMILLSTLATLVPFSFSVASYGILLAREKNIRPSHGRMMVAAVAFVFSICAIIGSGEETVYWGFILLMAGVPLYVLMKWQNKEIT